MCLSKVWGKFVRERRNCFDSLEKFLHHNESAVVNIYLLGQLDGHLKVSVHVLLGLTISLLLHLHLCSLPLLPVSLFPSSSLSLHPLLVKSITFSLFLFPSLPATKYTLVKFLMKWVRDKSTSMWQFNFSYFSGCKILIASKSTSNILLSFKMCESLTIVCHLTLVNLKVTLCNVVSCESVGWHWSTDTAPSIWLVSWDQGSVVSDHLPLSTATTNQNTVLIMIDQSEDRATTNNVLCNEQLRTLLLSALNWALQSSQVCHYQ